MPPLPFPPETELRRTTHKIKPGTAQAELVGWENLTGGLRATETCGMSIPAILPPFAAPARFTPWSWQARAQRGTLLCRDTSRGGRTLPSAWPPASSPRNARTSRGVAAKMGDRPLPAVCAIGCLAGLTVVTTERC